jgi:hypothetical protein
MNTAQINHDITLSSIRLFLRPPKSPRIEKMKEYAPSEASQDAESTLSKSTSLMSSKDENMNGNSENYLLFFGETSDTMIYTRV